MQQQGARVTVMHCDVSREEDVRRVISEIDQHLRPLRGVIHSAGVLEDSVLTNQTWEKFTKVLAPKVMGSWNLHRFTAGTPLDFFVLYASIAGVLGSPGQGNHAAANSFLDALAAHRRAQGLPSD